jgi:two-component system cell cycle response regulator DivK
MAGETILIVDDAPMNLQLAGAILKREGYQIHTAEDGRQALDMLQSSRPDLILSDIQMPGMDGLEMTRIIKQDSRWAGIPVIAWTAYASQVNELQAIEAGFDDYLTKPVDVQTLRSRIRTHLGRR